MWDGTYRTCHVCNGSGVNPPKVGRGAKITRKAFTGLGGWKSDWLEAFATGDKVVVILESEYDELVRKATEYDGLVDDAMSV
jgi:hypothetical protein